MSRSTDLESIIAEHSEALFGRLVTPSQFAVEPLAIATRQVYRVRPVDRKLAPLIVKARSVGTRTDRQAVDIQTRHEFTVQAAVHQAMAATKVAEHAVPRPLLVLPELGLLFMEEAPGKAVEHWLAREFLGLVRASENDRRVRRCGEWLFTFSLRANRLAPQHHSEAAERLLTAGRANHHVYCLIGLAGSSLVAGMAARVRNRLESYRVEATTSSRIVDAFGKALDGLNGPRDLQGNVHGKYSIADVLVSPSHVVAIDLEQTSTGSLYLDAAYFLSQIVMFTRWRPVGRNRRVVELRSAFLAGRSPDHQLDERLLDAFIAYFLVNSLRPAGGITGITARARAAQWIDGWLDGVLGRQPAPQLGNQPLH